jgi:uncharacterized membrane protein
MSFHVGGHKPTPAVERFRVPIRNRLVVALIGICLVLIGLYRVRSGSFVGTNWFGQPVFSTDILVLGVAVVLLALIPTFLLEKITNKIVNTNPDH